MSPQPLGPSSKPSRSPPTCCSSRVPKPVTHSPWTTSAQNYHPPTPYTRWHMASTPNAPKYPLPPSSTHVSLKRHPRHHTYVPPPLPDSQLQAPEPASHSPPHTCSMRTPRTLSLQGTYKHTHARVRRGTLPNGHTPCHFSSLPPCHHLTSC